MHVCMIHMTHHHMIMVRSRYMYVHILHVCVYIWVCVHRYSVYIPDMWYYTHAYTHISTHIT